MTVGPGFFPAPFELRGDNPVHYHCVLVKDVHKPEIEIVVHRSCYHGTWAEADLCRHAPPIGGARATIETCMLEDCDPRADNRHLRLVRG